MAKRIAINGFGRIGRLTFRQLIARHPELEVVAINDPFLASDWISYLLTHDSVHKKWEAKVAIEGDNLVVNDKKIKLIQQKDCGKLPWKEMNIDIVLECSGVFTEVDKCKPHIDAGAKKVIISAPSTTAPMYVLGCNEKKLKKEEAILSMASCTTNCLAPLAKIINDHFGIEEGLMTTIHASTATQVVVDGVVKKFHRDGRSALCNVIPASTGAAKAVGQVIPELKGKLTGMAFRVPTPDVSCVDLTVKLKNKTTYDDIKKKVKEVCEGELKGLYGYTEDDVTSTDFVTDEHSGVFDAGAGIMLNPTFVKLIAWYDNEFGYSTRLADFCAYVCQHGF